MNIRAPLLVSLAAIALAGCASAPKPLAGVYAPLLPDDAARAQTTGATVRWGGELVAVDTQAARTCFEVVARPLSASARPESVDRSAGRFLACRRGFYDPAVFAVGREVTVTGRVDAYETRRIGEYDYRYPRVAADVVYLWPERRDVQARYAPSPFWSPYWGPYWGPWGPW